MRLATIAGLPQPSPDSQLATSQTTQPFKFNFATTSTSTNLPSILNSQGNQFSPSSTDLPPAAGSETLTQFPKPIFSFSNPTTSSISAQPVLNEKRASIGTVQLPAVPNNQSNPQPADTQIIGTLGKSFSFLQEVPSSSAQPITQSRSAEFPVQPPVPTQVTQPQELAVQGPDREQLLHDLVRLGLVQPDGILDMFISHKLSNLVRGVFDSFQQRQFNRRVGKDFSW